MIPKQLIKLHFQSPIHLSKGRGNQESSFEVLHSDTLKSAIYYNALILFGEENLLKGQGTQCSFMDAFRITSAFPFFKQQLFFPKPQITLPDIEGIESSKQRKAKKKIQFLNHQYFEALINGNLAAIKTEHLVLNGSYINGLPELKQHSNSSLLGKENNTIDIIETPFMASKVQQKVMVPRAEDVDSDTYYMDRIYFQKEAGLFFLIEYKAGIFEGIEQTVQAALTLLGENGIGSDRNTGNGQFIATFEKELPFRIPANGDKQINLSLYCPNKQADVDKMMTKESAFRLLKRGGFIASPTYIDHITYRKKSIYMIAEGAVFPNVTLEGKMADLKPDPKAFPKNEKPLEHAIWREGRAIFIPVKA